MRVAALETTSDERVGGGGFLTLRRVRLRNVREDGSRSDEYLYDFLDRDKGLDAVVVVAWCRRERIEVLLRDQIRVPLALGRDDPPVADAREYLMLREVVAGIVERADRGEAGLRQRAALELEEEAGYLAPPEAFVILGAGMFPSPGATPERFWFLAVEIDPDARGHAPGDGSPAEEGSALHWVPLDDAIAMCVRGELEDMKTELACRRLADRLSASPARGPSSPASR